MNRACVRRGVFGILLAFLCLGARTSGAQPDVRRTGWAELSRVEPGTTIVVQLTDGRRLERHMVGATADALDTVDVSSVASRDRRAQILDLVRKSPERYTGPVFVDQNGTRIPITQRIDRAMIVTVSRPKSVVFVLPTPVDWLLHYAGPCPNCDTAQTALTGQTPLPSPLPRKADVDPLVGKVIYRAPAAAFPNPLDSLTWTQLQPLLPVSLRGK
jgi:hypothetical protein